MSKLGWPGDRRGAENILDFGACRERTDAAGEPDLVDPALFARAIDAIETEHFFVALRDFVDSAVKIDNCVALVFSSERPPLILHQWSPQQPNYFQMLYCQGAYVLDPFYRVSLDEQRGGAYMLDEIAPDSFNESEFYQTYYRKVEMIDEIGLLWPLDGRRTMHLSLGRRSKSQHFTAAEALRIRHLEPILNSLLKRHSRGLIDHWQGHTDGAGEITSSSAAEIAGRWLNPYSVTQREAEIAAMVLRGHSNTSIGLTLNISIETVKVHRRNLYAKLRISSQAELYMLFINHILGANDARARGLH